MSRLTRDGTAEPVSRDQILRHARGQGNIIFSVQLTTSRIGNLTRLIHTLLYVMTIHTYIHFGLATNTLNVRNNNNNIPTEIQIATRSYANLQAMAPTNNKTVHQTSFITPYREQPRSTRIVVAYPRPAFSAINRTNTFQPVCSISLIFSRPHIVQK